MGQGCFQRGSQAMNKTVAVTGAGASGLVAAAGAASLGARVLLFDQNDRIGRKLSATGNGKGNIANCRMEEQCYHSEEPEELSRIYRDIHRDEVLQLLEDRGIVLHARQGYIYPRTDLAATVTEGLWQWIAEVGTELHLQEAVTGVQKVPSGFLIRTGTGEEYRADALILATGGMAGPQFGCDGSGYQIARSLGHQCTAVRPSLTALKTKDPVLHFAAGVRCLSTVRMVIGRSEETAGGTESGEFGEVQFGKDSISGIPVFQLSSDAGRALAQGESVRLILDLLPEFDRDSGTFSPGRKAAELIGGTWEQEWNRRMQDTRNISIAEWMNGLAVPRLAAMIAARAGLTAENKIRKLTREQLAMLLSLLRHFEIEVTGTGTYRDAQVTSGGIRLSEIGASFASLLCPGLYFAGEILDIEGICGGYNLTFAMSSGWSAGRAAAAAGIPESVQNR